MKVLVAKALVAVAVQVALSHLIHHRCFCSSHGDGLARDSHHFFRSGRRRTLRSMSVSTPVIVAVVVVILALVFGVVFAIRSSSSSSSSSRSSSSSSSGSSAVAVAIPVAVAVAVAAVDAFQCVGGWEGPHRNMNLKTWHELQPRAQVPRCSSSFLFSWTRCWRICWQDWAPWLLTVCATWASRPLLTSDGSGMTATIFVRPGNCTWHYTSRRLAHARTLPGLHCSRRHQSSCHCSGSGGGAGVGLCYRPLLEAGGLAGASAAKRTPAAKRTRMLILWRHQAADVRPLVTAEVLPPVSDKAKRELRELCLLAVTHFLDPARGVEIRSMRRGG